MEFLAKSFSNAETVNCFKADLDYWKAIKQISCQSLLKAVKANNITITLIRDG